MPNVSSRWHVALVFVVAVIGGIGFPRSARSEGEEDAAIRRGVELRRARKDQEALEEFQRAYSVAKSARALAQIGLAEQALGRWVDAEAHLSQALSNTAQPWIHKNAPVLRNALVEIQPHLGSLDVIGPPGAEAWVNGLIVGTLPFSKAVRIPIGTVNVELRKSGFLATSRTVSVSPGLLARETFDLAPAPPPPAPPVSTLGVPGPHSRAEPAAPVALRGGEGDDRPAPPPEIIGDQGWHWPLAWGTAVGALVGAGAGATALLLRSERGADISKYQCNPKNGTVSPPDTNNTNRCLDLANSSSTWGVTAVVTLSIAGVLAITSVVLFATAPAKPSGSVAVACAPNLVTPGAFCQLQF